MKIYDFVNVYYSVAPEKEEKEWKKKAYRIKYNIKKVSKRDRAKMVVHEI